LAAIIEDEDAKPRFKLLMSSKTEIEYESFLFLVEMEEYKKCRSSRQFEMSARAIILRYFQPECKVFTTPEMLLQLEQSIIQNQYDKNTFAAAEEKCILVVSKYCASHYLPAPHSDKKRHKLYTKTLSRSNRALSPKSGSSKFFRTSPRSSTRLFSTELKPETIVRGYQSAFMWVINEKISKKTVNIVQSFQAEVPVFPLEMFEILFFSIFGLKATTTNNDQTVIIDDEDTVKMVLGDDLKVRVDDHDGDVTIVLPLIFTYKMDNLLLVLQGSCAIHNGKQ